MPVARLDRERETGRLRLLGLFRVWVFASLAVGQFVFQAGDLSLGRGELLLGLRLLSLGLVSPQGLDGHLIDEAVDPPIDLSADRAKVLFVRHVSSPPLRGCRWVAGTGRR